MSRIYDALQQAEATKFLQRSACERTERPFQVLTLTSNKGGVGKTTVATNLAVYLRALREDLPILLLGLDDQPMVQRMFALDPRVPRETVASALRTGSFASAIRLGQYGVHHVPYSPEVSELKREILDPTHLETALRRTEWHGLVIVDTKSDLEILTRNAIAAADLAVVVVNDHASLNEAQKVFDLLDEWGRSGDRARILLSLIDLRIKYRDEENRDILTLLLSDIRRRGLPVFETFISRSPKVESLYTNPDGRAHSILHGAGGSIVDRQMRCLADDVLSALDRSARGRLDPLPLVSGKQEPSRLIDLKRWFLHRATGSSTTRGTTTPRSKPAHSGESYRRW